MTAVAKNKSSLAPTKLLRPHVVRMYAEECATLPIREQRMWVEKTADMFEVSEVVVRKIVSDYLEDQHAQIRAANATTAQTIATNLGATLTTAITVLNQGMRATKTVSVEAGKDERGKLLFHKVQEPDWTERRQAAKLVIDIHGGFAPQEINVTHKTEDLDGLSEDELNRRIASATIAYAEAKDAVERKEKGYLITDGGSIDPNDLL